jgi:glucosyl-3-phosphoglycerate synthase
MEARLLQASARIPVGVVIPALYSDLASPAMKHIIQELAQMKFIQRVYISLDRADEQDFRQARAIVAPLGEKSCLLWNDNPQVQVVIQKIDNLLPLGPRGKGRAVWTALGYILTKGEVAVLAFHDADIVTYDRSFLVRLLYTVVQLRYQFAKGFYARYDDRLFGRVVRLFYFPFVRSLREILGNLDLAYDLHRELTAVETFAHALDRAFDDFHQYLFGSPLIPEWRRIEVALDGIMEELTEALDIL